MTELSNEKFMTTKEVAEALCVGESSIKRAVEKLRPNLGGLLQNNQGGFVFTEAQVTAIKLELQNHSKVNAFTPKTALEKQLLIAQAMQIQQEMIAELQKENAEQKQQLIEQKPKVDTYNRIADGKGCFTINQTAKALKLPYGNITLFENLRVMGLLNHDNTPKQEQINNGNFRVVVKHINDNIGNKNVTLVTSRGLVYLAKRFNTTVDKNVKADA